MGNLPAHYIIPEACISPKVGDMLLTILIKYPYLFFPRGQGNESCTDWFLDALYHIDMA